MKSAPRTKKGLALAFVAQGFLCVEGNPGSMTFNELLVALAHRARRVDCLSILDDHL